MAARDGGTERGYLGRTRAPDRFDVYPTPVIRGDTLWGVVQGELDVPYVVRLVGRPDARRSDEATRP